MAAQIGKAHLEGFGSATLKQYDASGTLISITTGFVSPNIQSLKLTHQAPDIKEVKSQAGTVTGLIIPDDEIIECTFEYIPEGTSVATSPGSASLSATLPAIGTRIQTSGLPTVSIGSFSDALNAGSASTGSPWLYLGGATLNGVSDGFWTVTLPVKRFKNITSSAQLS